MNTTIAATMDPSIASPPTVDTETDSQGQLVLIFVFLIPCILFYICLCATGVFVSKAGDAPAKPARIYLFIFWSLAFILSMWIASYNGVQQRHLESFGTIQALLPSLIRSDVVIFGVFYTILMLITGIVGMISLKKTDHALFGLAALVLTGIMLPFAVASVALNYSYWKAKDKVFQDAFDRELALMKENPALFPDLPVRYEMSADNIMGVAFSVILVVMNVAAIAAAYLHWIRNKETAQSY